MAEASQGQSPVNVNLNIELDLVKAAEDIVAAAAEAVAWAERSCVIEVDNQLPFPLAYESSESIHGGFGQTPKHIPPMSPDVFSSRSSGVMTGTEGKAAYRFGDNYKLSIHWINPFAGGNETHCLVEPADGNYRAVSITGNGNHGAHMRFIIAARPLELGPPDWRTCGKCKTLFSVLDEEGHCAAQPLGIRSAPSGEILRQAQAPGSLRSRALPRDIVEEHSPPPPPPPPLPPRSDPATADVELFGKHEAAGYYFRLPYGLDGPRRERDWRKCRHCKGLFYNGETTKGVCPGRRDGHIAEAESREYQLIYGRPAGPSQQDNWRFCDKCYAMFFLPQNDAAVCPAGGNHRAWRESYVLDYQG